MLNNNAIGLKVVQAANVTLILIQVVLISAFYGLITSKSEINSISSEIEGGDTIKNNFWFDIIMTQGFLYILFSALGLSIIKEFMLKYRNHKLAINILFTIIISILFSLTSQNIFSPLGNL